MNLKCSLLSFSRFRILGSSHSWSYPPYFFGDATPTSTVTSSLDFSSWYSSTAQSGPSDSLLLMQHVTPPLPSNLLSFFRPLCIFSLCTLTTASCSWLFLFTSCFLFPSLTPSRFFNEMLGVSEPEALKCCTSSHQVDLICIQQSNLNLSSSFGTHGFSALQSDCGNTRSGIFLLMSQTLAAASLSFLPPLFLCLTPTLITQRSTFL